MKLPDEVREFFRRQGRIGGKKRLETISPERRREIARHAVETRWAKAKKAKTGAQGKSRKPRR
jgi:hypothetical protein